MTIYASDLSLSTHFFSLIFSLLLPHQEKKNNKIYRNRNYLGRRGREKEEERKQKEENEEVGSRNEMTLIHSFVSVYFSQQENFILTYLIALSHLDHHKIENFPFTGHMFHSLIEPFTNYPFRFPLINLFTHLIRFRTDHFND